MLRLGYYDLTFTNSRGDSISMGSTLPYLMQGVIGLDMPGSDIQSKRAPFQDGTTFTDALLLSRDIEIDLHIIGADDAAIYSARDILGGIFSPKLGEGILTIDYENITRTIACVPERVLMPNNGGNRVCGYQAAKIRLVASNPAILDEDFTRTELAAFTGGFTLPFSFPISFGTIGTEVTIENTGHLDRPIIITGTGALQTPTFTNETTGEKIELSNAGGLDLLVGETLTIDTNPSSPSITITDGVTTTNAYKYLSSDSILWQMQVGDNDISYTAISQDANPFIDFKRGWLIV